MQKPSKFAQWLLETRTATELSQKDLVSAAKEADKTIRLKQPRISEWEKGIRTPSLRQFYALCRAMRLGPVARREGRALWDAAQLEDTDHEPPSGGVRGSGSALENENTELIDPLTAA